MKKISGKIGGGEICIRVNLSTVQWVYLYTFFSNFRGQNRGEICIHRRSKQGWNLYTKGQGKGDICLLYFINFKDFFRVKAKFTFVYLVQITCEICILFPQNHGEYCIFWIIIGQSNVEFCIHLSNQWWNLYTFWLLSNVFLLRIYKGFSNMYSIFHVPRVSPLV